MKNIFALFAALVVGTAYAQENRHMIEFNADSVLLTKFAFNKSKARGTDADNDTQATITAGYALTVPAMPRLQLGARTNYVKATKNADVENYGLQVGGIWNNSEDLTNSMYLSLYFGLQWNHTYGNVQTTDENRVTTLALGKRCDLSRWGVKHLTYTPEIALVNQNSTTGSQIEYSQNLEVRLIQFSAFF